MDDKPLGNLIEVRSLTKKFGDLTAVNGISFDVKHGEAFAFLGPNGAGKSTTIKMLITLLKPTSGTALINGFDLVHNSSNVRRDVGYVPQMISVDGTLTAYENMALMAKLYDIPWKECEQRVRETLSFFDLDQYSKSLVRTFSGGMIRKLEIGQAIIHRPKVLFLDEPTSGLDPIARQKVWEHILELRKTYGTTIFFSTHQMEEADEMSDRVAIMHNGKIAIIGSPEEIKGKTKLANATLEDAFIYFSGTDLKETGNLSDISRTRRAEARLG